MSERTEVMVELPLARRPTLAEEREIYRAGFAAARRLIAPHGRVLGLTSQAVGVNKITAEPTIFLKFAVLAPEAIQP